MFIRGETLGVSALMFVGSKYQAAGSRFTVIKTSTWDLESSKKSTILSETLKSLLRHSKIYNVSMAKEWTQLKR